MDDTQEIPAIRPVAQRKRNRYGHRRITVVTTREVFIREERSSWQVIAQFLFTVALPLEIGLILGAGAMTLAQRYGWGLPW